ncbi:MAG: TIGR04086 family membrane protein [Clostridia bacterium]|nr:TIGR04086 family membrane protein [Clostridia bacterium]MBQ6557957.1 TIGR04086 family membrane protein [Clostridia bacterium]
MSVNIKAVLRASAISIGLTAVILFIVSLLAYFTSVSDTVITICAYAAVILGVMCGSALIAHGAAEKKLAHVALMCAIFAAVLITVSLILNGRLTFNVHTAGIIGGIIASAFLGAVIGNR